SRRVWKGLAVVGLAGVAALALSLPQLLPFLTLLHESRIFQTRTSGFERLGVGIFIRGSFGNLKNLLLSINPYLYGTPLGDRSWLPRYDTYSNITSYMGVLALPWIIVGISAVRRQRMAYFWIVVGLVSVVLTDHLPGL